MGTIGSLIACTPSPEPLLPTSSSETGTSTHEGGAVSETSAADVSSGTSGLAPDGTCTEDWQCGMLECVGDRCDGCSTWADCPAGLLCWQRACYPAEDLPRCNGVIAPSCGDGVIGALEECEGGAGCTDCRRDEAIEVVVRDMEIDELYVAPNGVMFAIESYAGSITRWDDDDAPTWSSTTDLPVAALAMDPAGGVYFTGSTGPGFPRLDAWASDAVPRWSVQHAELGTRYVLAADDARVLVGGQTEQDNSPWGRGFLAQYDLDGMLAWSRKVPEWSYIGALALDGDDATVLGVHLYGPARWSLMRIDDTGAPRWSFELPVQPSWLQAVNGMIGDGDGGTWIFGERDDGPWAVHHDDAGDEREVLDCFGATTGRIVGAAVAPSGALALAVVVDPGPIPIPRARAWIAVIEGGEVTRALTYDVDDDRWDPFGLGWRADGRLAIGLQSYYPDQDAVVVLTEL